MYMYVQVYTCIHRYRYLYTHSDRHTFMNLFLHMAGQVKCKYVGLHAQLKQFRGGMTLVGDRLVTAWAQVGDVVARPYTPDHCEICSH